MQAGAILVYFLTPNPTKPAPSTWLDDYRKLDYGATDTVSELVGPAGLFVIVFVFAAVRRLRRHRQRTARASTSNS